MKLPDRAKKYFSSGRGDWMPGGFDDFPNACRALQLQCSYKPKELIATLADRMDRVVDDCDLCINIVADGAYDKDRTTRAKAMLDTQAWAMAYTEEGETFARENGFDGDRFSLVEWIGQNYPFKVRLTRSHRGRSR